MILGLEGPSLLPPLLPWPFGVDCLGMSKSRALPFASTYHELPKDASSARLYPLVEMKLLGMEAETRSEPLEIGRCCFLAMITTVSCL